MMAKRTLWQWLFGLMAKPEQDRQPMATPNNPVRQKPMTGTVSLTEDEWNERCSGGAQVIINRTSQQQPAGPNQGVAGFRGYADNIEGQRALSDVELRDMALRYAEGSRNSHGTQYSWRPGIEHSHPHPVKENPDGTLYYKGKVYRMIGDHGRRNNKRRQG